MLLSSNYINRVGRFPLFAIELEGAVFSITFKSPFIYFFYSQISCIFAAETDKLGPVAQLDRATAF